MKTELETLRGYKLKAKDGEIGRVRDLLIDEGSWTGRWIVVDTGKWLLGRKVVLSPIAFEAPDHKQKVLPVNLSREQIEKAPHLDEHAPVSREYEKTYFDHYQWPYYWSGGSLWGGAMYPRDLNPSDTENQFEPPTPPEDKEIVLRSAHELTKYRLISGGETLGYVEDILLCSDDWSVKALQFDTRKWFHGKTLRLSPDRISRISWEDHAVYVDEDPEELKDTGREIRMTAESTNAQVHALYGIPVGVNQP